MPPVDTSRDDLRCGLCGQVVNARHEQHHEGSAVVAGRRAECVVIADCAAPMPSIKLPMSPLGPARPVPPTWRRHWGLGCRIFLAAITRAGRCLGSTAASWSRRPSRLRTRSLLCYALLRESLRGSPDHTGLDTAPSPPASSTPCCTGRAHAVESSADPSGPCRARKGGFPPRRTARRMEKMWGECREVTTQARQRPEPLIRTVATRELSGAWCPCAAWEGARNG